MKTALFLTDKQIDMLLQAINQVDEYTTEWDELYGVVAKRGVEYRGEE